MSHDPPTTDFADVPFEEIGGLTISPHTDIPFGKPFQMGMVIYTIYDKAIEEGYVAGIRAHQQFMRESDDCSPGMPDDVQFSRILKTFVPEGMSERNAMLWRAHFIAGWASVYLGLVREREEEAYE